jgi:poly(3-hydroxybutyrate) depolymerase
MDAGRPLLLVVGAGLSLLAALPATLSSDPAVADPDASTRLVAAATTVTPTAASTTTVTTSQTYEGRPRSFVLHVPGGLLAPAPLVVALHAHSQTTDSIRAYSELERLADQEGFVVAFPSGVAGSWNAGGCCGPSQADDVAFLDEVIALARTRAAIDEDRIGFTGSSNGAFMALHYACERSDTAASVAVVSGAYVSACAPADPVPVLALHGQLDSVVPLAGGRNEALDVAFPPVQASLAPFRDVEVRVVPGVGHTWMADASRQVWEWIRDHPRVRTD